MIQGEKSVKSYIIELQEETEKILFKENAFKEES